MDKLTGDDDEAAANLGVVMEGSAADYVAARHCGLYTVGNIMNRHFAMGFAKGAGDQRNGEDSFLKACHLKN